MRAQRQQPATRVLLVLTMVLASLWAGGLARSAVGGSADQVAASRALRGVDPAALPDRVPALDARAERPSQSGRLAPLLLGMQAAALAVLYGACAGRLRSGQTRPRPLVQLTRLAARAPPLLQPAQSSRPAPLTGVG